MGKVNWTPENDRKLLLQLINPSTKDIQVDYLATLFPGATPKSITERIAKLRREKKASADGNTPPTSTTPAASSPLTPAAAKTATDPAWPAADGAKSNASANKNSSSTTKKASGTTGTATTPVMFPGLGDGSPRGRKRGAPKTDTEGGDGGGAPKGKKRAGGGGGKVANAVKGEEGQGGGGASRGGRKRGGGAVKSDAVVVKSEGEEEVVDDDGEITEVKTEGQDGEGDGEVEGVIDLKDDGKLYEDDDGKLYVYAAESG